MIDKKMLSTVVVIIVIIASMGAVIAYDASKDDSGTNNVYNILARVNTAGSGIYMNEEIFKDDNSDGIPDRNGVNFYKIENGSFYTDKDCADAWRGLVVGTPGSTSIQHVQLRSLVENTGLAFKSYQQSDTPSTEDDCVYYIDTIINYDRAMNSKSNNNISLDMGIIWEPQYSYITAVKSTEEFVQFALTKNFFGYHSCCVLAGYSSYINSHTDVTVRFLAAYIEAVNWMVDATDKDSEDYNEEYHEALVSKAVDMIFGDAIKRDEIKDYEAKAVIESAIENIKYVYGDGSDGVSDLHMLKRDIAEIVEKNKSSLQRSMSSLGFANPLQFANRFVDDSYLQMACAYQEYTGTSTARISVAAISGDIHQIALQMGVEKEFFNDFGIEVNIAYQTNGAGVAVALQNGSAQFGFLGAPPATITAVNGALITV